MIACPRHIARAYQFEELAEQWQTGPLLGIEPRLLNDDRILRAMSDLGGDPRAMEGVLYMLVIGTSKKAGLPHKCTVLCCQDTIFKIKGSVVGSSQTVMFHLA